MAEYEVIVKSEGKEIDNFIVEFDNESGLTEFMDNQIHEYEIPYTEIYWYIA